MYRALAAIALSIATPASAVVVGTTDLAGLDGIEVSGGFFPAIQTLDEAARDYWRTTFSLARATEVRLLVIWNDRTEWNCVPNTPCDDFATEQFDHTNTAGVRLATVDLGRTGEASTRYDPLTDFPEVLDSFDSGFGYSEASYVHETFLNLAAGDYTLDLGGFGAAGGPAFPGSGGGFYTLNLEALPVPEPAAWALLIAGFAAVGTAMRRARLTAPA